MANEKIIVQLASPERKYVKIYHDFLDNPFLSVEEQMIFIVLKSFIGFRSDSGDAYPSMETICRRAKMSEKRARKNINALIKKGIVKKVQRGLTKTNLYTLSDYVTMWGCDNLEDVAIIANNQGIRTLTPEEHIAALEKMGYKIEIKKKGPESEPTKAQIQAPQLNKTDVLQHTTVQVKSQVERYTTEQIRQLYDYDALIHDNPYHRQDIDAVVSILHTALNTDKEKIRVSGEDKPSMVVIGKLMKLSGAEIMYAIKKYQAQTDRIKNPTSYMLTLLYGAKEQLHLDLTNRVQHDMAHGDDQREEYNP